MAAVVRSQFGPAVYRSLDRSFNQRLGSLTVAACAAMSGFAADAAPFVPLEVSGVSPSRGQYTEERLAPDHYLLRFRSNSTVRRERLHQYLLYGAATLTAQTGNDWFELVDKRRPQANGLGTKQRPSYRAQRGPRLPDWRYYSPNACLCACSCLVDWRNWSGPAPGLIQPNQRQRGEKGAREAMAEFLVGKGAAPPGDRRAMDARRILLELSPKIGSTEP